MKGLFVLLLLFLAHGAQQASAQGGDICQLTCTELIYDKFCGGAECVAIAKTQEQIEGMCSTNCSGAITGGVMLECLTRFDSSRPDWEMVQLTMDQQIRQICIGMDLEIPGDVQKISFDGSDLDFDDIDGAPGIAPDAESDMPDASPEIEPVEEPVAGPDSGDEDAMSELMSMESDFNRKLLGILSDSSAEEAVLEARLDA